MKDFLANCTLVAGGLLCVYPVREQPAEAHRDQTGGDWISA